MKSCDSYPTDMGFGLTLEILRRFGLVLAGASPAGASLFFGAGAVRFLGAARAPPAVEGDASLTFELVAAGVGFAGYANASGMTLRASSTRHSSSSSSSLKIGIGALAEALPELGPVPAWGIGI